MSIEANPPKSAKELAELSIPECEARADDLLKQYGVCLMLLDAVDSQHNPQFNGRFADLLNDLNGTFQEYFPENNLTAPERLEQGFSALLGDGATAGINSSDVIAKVAEHVALQYPDIPLRYSIAKDGWDDTIALVK